jgi:hypothetical protein
LDFYYEEEISPADVMRNGFVFAQFTPWEFYNLDFARFDRLVTALEACAMGGRRKLVLQFDDYDADYPYGYFEIPEVCEFISRLFLRCPHLYYFLHNDRIANRAFFLCITGLRDLSISEEGSISCEPIISSRLREVADATHVAVKEYGFSCGDPVGAMIVLNDLGLLSIGSE